MKANELRIGNIIGWRLGTGELVIGRVHAIESDKIAISEKRETISEDGEPATGQGFMMLEGVEPIPITDDWLSKFKFRKTEAYEPGIGTGKAPLYIITTADNDSVEIMYWQNMFWYGYRVYDGGTSELWEPFAEMKYIHQLQNLYFALVGNELELK